MREPANVRDAARCYIEGVLETDMPSEELTRSLDESLSPEDRALFQELTQGALREWMFLDWAVAKYAARPPRGTLRAILNLSAYQLLFLDRIPDYAIFSQAAAIASSLGLSEPELKFVHGLLKSIQRHKAKLLEVRAASLDRARAGLAPESELEWAVLNMPQGLLDTLTVVDEKGKKKSARARALRAAVAMKERARLVGYALPGAQLPTAIFSSLSSAVAPRAIVLKGSPELVEDLAEGRVRIQGEASQWACEKAAEWIVGRMKANGQTPSPLLRVLETATGKGGKLLGTLAALSQQLGGAENVPQLEWHALDASSAQLKIFQDDTMVLARKYWPQVRVLVRQHDGERDGEQRLPPGIFDLIWLDAPCTGYGTISKLPQIALTRGEKAYENALALATIQQNLCAMTAPRLAPQGAFLYTVCTLTRPETLGVVDFCATKLGGRLLWSHALWPGSEPAPHAEGFFAAIFA